MSGGKLLAADEPAAVETLREDSRSRLVLVCDHAGRRIPRVLGDLGLPAAERERHIAWDIGALGVAERLSDAFDATLVWQNYSRLVVDCNRPPGSAELFTERSEATVVPGNVGLDDHSRKARLEHIYRPYHDSIARVLDSRATRDTVFVAVHSFTPVYHGQSRPWHIGVLHNDDAPYARAVLRELEAIEGITVGENEPYRIDGKDHTIPAHPRARGLDYVLLEIRQDEIADSAGQARWAALLAPVLAAALESI